jgi:hypothetical protein
MDSRNRRSDRSPVAMSARCRTEKGGRAYVAVINLSEQGCCLLMKDSVLHKGQRVQLWPDGMGNLIAQVQWTNGDVAGLKFESPLYGPVFEHLTKLFSRSDDVGPEVENGARSGPLSDTLREELLERIRRREAAAANEAPKGNDLYRTIKIFGTRPGLKARQSDEKLVRLFLG